MDGILVALKPPGMTSHDVVDFVRRLARQRRVGHTGTLDPGAAGVLVVCLGAATRLVEYLTPFEKQYRAEVTFGIATDTQDAHGYVVQEAAVDGVSAAAVEDVLRSLEGDCELPPPMVSAVRHGGRRLYELAREGKVVERDARRVNVRRCLLRDYDGGPPPRAIFDVVCSKGTYVRSLCAELGERLGCGAHMSFLVRTRNGPWTLEQAMTLEELDAAARERRLADHLLPLDAGLIDCPRVELPEEAARRLARGTPVAAPPGAAQLTEGALVRVCDGAGRFFAVARAARGSGETYLLAPAKVFRQGGDDGTTPTRATLPNGHGGKGTRASG
jgi:tRNA pseudouridine55 synthase